MFNSRAFPQQQPAFTFQSTGSLTTGGMPFQQQPLQRVPAFGEIPKQLAQTYPSMAQLQQQQQQAMLGPALTAPRVKVYLKPANTVKVFDFAAFTSFEAMQQKLLTFVQSGDDYKFFFADEENDWITLEEAADWEECLLVFKMSRRMKLKVVVKSKPVERVIEEPAPMYMTSPSPQPPATVNTEALNGVVCNSCQKLCSKTAYRCLNSKCMDDDYDLCQTCYNLRSNFHDLTHQFVPMEVAVPKFNNMSISTPAIDTFKPKDNAQLVLEPTTIVPNTNVPSVTTVIVTPALQAKYAGQIELLRNMGFSDEKQIIELLVQHNGDIGKVVNLLV